MANSIRNSNQRSVIHCDTTDGAITLAELTATNESTVVKAHIVDIYWQTAGSVAIDRGGTAAHTFTGTGHWNLAQSGCELRGDVTADIGIDVTGATYAIIVVHKSY